MLISDLKDIRKRKESYGQVGQQLLCENKRNKMSKYVEDERRVREGMWDGVGQVLGVIK